MDMFREHMKKVDLTLVSLEQKRLKFERECHQNELEDRAMKRNEQIWEREADRRERREKYQEDSHEQ